MRKDSWSQLAEVQVDEEQLAVAAKAVDAGSDDSTVRKQIVKIALEWVQGR